jgi:hypothetical protein
MSIALIISKSNFGGLRRLKFKEVSPASGLKFMKNLTNKESAAKRPKPRRASGATSAAQAAQTSSPQGDAISAALPPKPRRRQAAQPRSRQRHLLHRRNAANLVEMSQFYVDSARL